MSFEYTSIWDLLFLLFFIFGVLSFLVTITFFSLKQRIFKNWLRNIFFGKGLVAASKKLADELPDEVQRETLGEFAGQTMIRLTRLGIFAFLLGLLPTLILFQQNKLLSNQNLLFSNQNKRIEQQTFLLEAERRSSYNFRLANVLDRMDDEIKEQRNFKRKHDVFHDHDLKYHLSQPLIGRISALSHALKPYRFLDGESLIDKPISPERGQLLVILLKSQLDDVTLNAIFENVNFQYADLSDCSIANMNLDKVNLAFANLSNLDLSNCSFKFANLQNANLVGTTIENTNFSAADLTNTILDKKEKQ